MQSDSACGFWHQCYHAMETIVMEMLQLLLLPVDSQDCDHMSKYCNCVMHIVA